MSKRRYFESDSRGKPGVVSEELRRALNIHKDKLPLWIYRMRVLGYPPGWLQQAQVNTLTLFDGNGTNAKEEEGEVDESVQYNKESLIEYPGFNVPVPEGVRDDWYYLRMPPMLEQQQLKEALKTMKVSEPVPYKRTKLDPTSLPSNSSPSVPSTSAASASASTPKKDDSSQQISSNESNSVNESPLSPKESGDQNSNEYKDNVFENLTEKSSENDCIESPNKPTESTEKSRKLKLIAMGSPMPASERPKRPSLEKWSEGMGELLYFENPSPVYTGNYKKKMKGIIEKIRQKNSQT